MSSEPPQPPADADGSADQSSVEPAGNEDATLGIPPATPSDDELSATVSRIWDEHLDGAETPEGTIGLERVSALSTLPRLTRHARLHDRTGDADQRRPAGASGSGLAGHEDETIGPADETLDTGGSGAGAPAGTVPRAAPPGASTGGEAPAPGDVDYEVLGVVGRGGMGTVYLARQVSLGREVALKRPLDDVHAQASESFLREALVTGELEHPGIVPVHDLAVDERGRPLMSMKLVRGRPWNERMAETGEQALSRRENLEILIRVCDAVAFAHSKGIVNRDIKPENVMVGDFGEVFVVDWGIAVDVASDAAVAKAEPLRRASGPAGTPRYMPPELALGQGDLIGPHTDVYLLGACLYEVLTGTPPHEGKGLTQVLVNAARGKIVDPRRRAPDRDVPSELAETCLKAMAPKPGDRFADVPAFQRALRDFLAHEESILLSDSGREQLARLESSEGIPPEERYAAFAAAEAAFEQALSLWDGNESARSGRSRALLGHAEEARARGDVGLVRSLLRRLEADREVDPARLGLLRQAVANAQALRRRVVLGVALVLALATAASVQVGGFLQEERAAETEERREDRLSAALRAARSAARSHRAAPGALPEAIRRARDLTEASDHDALRRLERLRFVHQLRLWRESRWHELAEDLDEDLGRVRLEPERALELSRHEKIRDTWLASHLASHAGEKEPLDLVAIAKGSRSPEALDAFLSAVELAGPRPLTARRSVPVALPYLDPELEAERLLAWRARLRRSALFALARRSFLETGDAAQASACARRVNSWRLESVPFGEPLPAAPEGLRVEWQPDGEELRGVELRSGREVWRRSLQRIGNAGLLPCADGSLLLLRPGTLLRLDPADGRVVDGRSTERSLFWEVFPDPQEPQRLVLFGAEGPFGLEELELGPTYQAGSREGVEELRAAVARELGLSPGDPRTAGETARRLEELARQEPRDFGLWSAALDQALEAPAGVRDELLASLLDRMLARVAPEDVPPRRWLVLGGQLHQQHRPREAERLWMQGRQAFLASDGNPDLSCAGAERMVEAAALARDEGDPARARSLHELASTFCSFVVGFEDLPRIVRRLDWGYEVQGARVRLPSPVPRETSARGDALFVFCCLLVPLLIALLARLRAKYAAARHAALRARGLPGFWHRLAAPAVAPGLALRFSTLSHASRAERATVALLSLLLLIGLGSLAATRLLGFGLGLELEGESWVLDQEALEARLLTTDSPRPELLLALAEWLHGQGRHGNAEQALKALDAREPHPLAKNNLAVLAERRGDLETAGRRFAEAAGLSGESAAVARWNAARLAGRPADRKGALEGMAHRDRVRAERLGPSAPLWAAAGYEDVFAPWRRTPVSPFEGLTQALRHQRMTRLLQTRQLRWALESERASGWSKVWPPAVAAVLVVGGLLSVLLLAAGLAWLPFPRVPPRPVSAAEAEPPGRASTLRAALAGLLAPGAWDLLRGSIPLGTLQLAVACAAFATWRAVQGVRLYREVDAPPLYPELGSWSLAALAVLAVLYAVNVPLTLRRARREAGSAAPLPTR